MAVYAQGEKGKKQLKLTQKKEEEHLAAFIKLCPVLSMDEGEMGKHFSANQIFEKLSNVYIERAVRSGYADNSLYNPDQLMNLTPEQEKALGDVHDLLSSMPSSWKPEKININKQGIGEGDGEQKKYIYYLTSKETAPDKPSMSAEYDDNNCPRTDDEGWDDLMCAPTQLFPYLFVSCSRFIEGGGWTNFSQPVLWKQWIDKEKNTDEAKKKRDEENKEKRARMSVLRGVSIRIPLLVYGAEINDEAGEEITIDNFASDEIVDDASWEEFMPKGFTKETFNILKDCFDRSIFTGAAKRIRQMVKEADTLNTEDRINKIATIFSYFHNPDKETVLTPWRVVNMHMSDCLGGWCFLNEEFDGNYTVENEYGENINAARFVDRGQVTKDVFGNYNARILEINSKTGLYPLYMAYSIFKNVKEPEWRKIELTEERGHSRDAEQYYHQAGNDLLIWRDVLQDNIFVVCRTKMAVSITKRTLAGFRKDIRMNVKCYEREVPVNDLVSAGIIKATDEGVTKVDKTYYFNEHETLECDMINVLRAKPELFQQDIVKGKTFWNVYNSIPISKNEDINNMKFSAIVGNPPYQVMDGGGAGYSAIPVYNIFVDTAKRANPDYLSVIIPARWFAGGKGLDGFRNEMLQDKHMRSLFDFPESRELFPSADIAGGICYFMRDNLTEGMCTVTTISGNERSSSERYLDEYETFVRQAQAVSILNKVLKEKPLTMEQVVFSRKPFGIDNSLVGEVFMTPDNPITLFGSQGISYINISQITQNADIIDRWKVIASKASAQGGRASKDGTRKVIPKVEILSPNAVCTESYLLINHFSNETEAKNARSYVITKFFRFLLSLKVITQNISKDCFQFIPLQDFTRPWTDADLYAKYDLTNDEIAYIERLIKPMD